MAEPRVVMIYLLVLCVSSVLIGVFTRMYQEKIRFIYLPIVLFRFVSAMVLDAVIPVLVLKRVLTNHNNRYGNRLSRRMYIGAISIPLSYLILLGSASRESNERIWAPLKNTISNRELMKKKQIILKYKVFNTNLDTRFIAKGKIKTELIDTTDRVEDNLVYRFA